MYMLFQVYCLAPKYECLHSQTKHNYDAYTTSYISKECIKQYHLHSTYNT